MQVLQKVRGSFEDWCRSFRQREDWLILDTETTGLKGQVIDIAIVDHTGATVYDQLIRPTCAVEAGAAAVHRITEAMLQNAPTWAEEYPKIEEIIKGKEIMTYNARFDMDRIMQSCMAHKIEMPEYTWHCLMLAYAKFYGAQDNYGRPGGWQKLEVACQQQKIQVRPAHRALADTKMTYALLMKCGSGEPLQRYR